MPGALCRRETLCSLSTPSDDCCSNAWIHQDVQVPDSETLIDVYNTHTKLSSTHKDADRDAVQMQTLAQRWHVRAYARTHAHTCTAKRSSWAGAVNEAATPCEPCDVVNTILPKPAGKRIHLCCFEAGMHRALVTALANVHAGVETHTPRVTARKSDEESIQLVSP